jgi:CheY-like chemotaxis protein
MLSKCTYNNNSTYVILQDGYLERARHTHKTPDNLEEPTDHITSDSNIQTRASSSIDNINEHDKTKPRILLVDDENDIAEAFRRGLMSKGFQVDAFNDPQKLLDNFEPGKYDVMITDIRMPGISGIELYKMIKKIDDKIKVFFVTAYEKVHEQESILNLGRNSFITKPISIESLANIIAE